MFPYDEYVTVSIRSTSYIKYRIQAFMAKLNYFRTRFDKHELKIIVIHVKRIKLKAVRALT